MLLTVQTWGRGRGSGLGTFKVRCDDGYIAEAVERALTRRARCGIWSLVGDGRTVDSEGRVTAVTYRGTLIGKRAGRGGSYPVLGEVWVSWGVA